MNSGIGISIHLLALFMEEKCCHRRYNAAAAFPEFNGPARKK